MSKDLDLLIDQRLGTASSFFLNRSELSAMIRSIVSEFSGTPSWNRGHIVTSESINYRPARVDVGSKPGDESVQVRDIFGRVKHLPVDGVKEVTDYPYDFLCPGDEVKIIAGPRMSEWVYKVDSREVNGVVSLNTAPGNYRDQDLKLHWMVNPESLTGSNYADPWSPDMADAAKNPVVTETPTVYVDEDDLWGDEEWVDGEEFDFIEDEPLPDRDEEPDLWPPPVPETQKITITIEIAR